MSSSAGERAYAHVKGRILDGSLPGGDFLTEGQVADVMGVSRTPVREAMLRLEAEGMLRLYPKKGAMVVPVTAAEAEDVIEARALLETWAARRTVERAADDDDEVADALERLVQQMREHEAAGDIGAFSTADRAFHETIVCAAGNEILNRVYRSLRERQTCLTASVMRVSHDRMTVAVADHLRLVELLRARDADGFVSLLERHIADAARYLRAGR